jgi:hypothetical protein
MKTQLLEDIGQSGTLSLVPSSKISKDRPNKVLHIPASDRAGTGLPRSAAGVWRQKPQGEPPTVAIQKPDQAPPLREAPRSLPDPVLSVDAWQESPQPKSGTTTPPGETAFDMRATDGTTVPLPDPLFDFAPRTSVQSGSDVPGSEPGWFERSGKRYLLWSACLLSAALAIKGGLWLHETRKDAGSLALVATEFKAEPQRTKAVKRRAIAAKEFTLGADGEVRVTPSSPATATLPVPPSSTVPPLVLLTTEPATGAKLDETTRPAVGDNVRDEPRKEEAVADRAPLPAPKPMRRSERADAGQAARSARAKVEHVSGPRNATAAVGRMATAPVADSTMTATLKACRAHGYTAAQCVRRACSVTKYGFVCRGK